MGRFHIKHESTYQGESEYTVFDRISGNSFRIGYRFALNDYLERYYNGSPEEYQRDVVGSLFIVHRCSSEMITWEVFEAFKKLLEDQWLEYLDHCEQRKQMFKGDPEIEKIYTAGPACLIVKPGYWDAGWHILDFGYPKSSANQFEAPQLPENKSKLTPMPKERRTSPIAVAL